MQKAKTARLPITLAVVLLLLAPISIVAASSKMGSTRAAFDTADDALVVIEQDGTHWSTLEQLNIFSSPGTEDTPVIAPSSIGSYAFTVQNQANYPFDYTLEISDENLAKVPMLFRLKSSEGVYLYGSDSLWVPIEAVEPVAGNLEWGGETGFLLEWRWPGDDDMTDTAAGILAREHDSYTLNFKVTAEQSGPAVDLINPSTGESAHPAVPLTILVISAMVLTVLVFQKTKRKEAFGIDE